MNGPRPVDTFSSIIEKVRSCAADLVGESVGRIRIIDVLGRGGMGTVYVGKDETLNRKVAVKAIHGDHRLHDEAKARFLREARILSQINHRNICTVHEFIESEGSDFLVLELVPGRNLRAAMKTQLSEWQKLSIARQLLEVLVAVHGQGVIHRDLKPENIMVKPDGEIAVLDFGLARSVDEDAAVFSQAPTINLTELESQADSEDRARDSDHAMSTQVKTTRGTLIGTLGYMSPEQARAEPATAASDMYSAGLILQELFTGSPPLDRGIGARGLILKTAEGQTLPVTGLPADLTALIERLKTLAPGARPSSVDALAQLQSIIDRPKRRRRRALVAAVWLALAVLAGGMTLQSVRASREAERANREAMAAQEVSDFLVGLFEESNPEQARGASSSAEEILQRGAERISGELEEQPLTRAVLLMTIAKVYRAMGLWAEAIPFLEEAIKIRTTELGEEHPEVAAALNDLGATNLSAGDLGKAETLLTRALELRERALGPESIEVAHTLLNLSNLSQRTGRLDEATSFVQRAQAIYEAEVGPDHVFTANGLATMAILMARQGRVEEAEPIFRSVLAILEKELGEDHPKTCEARNNLAIDLKMLGQFEESEALFRHTLEIKERVLGEDHPALAFTLGNLANLYAEMGRFEEAVPPHLRSIELRRSSLGADHPSVARALDNLGGVYIYLGRLEEAEAMCLEALAIREKALGPDHPSVGTSLHNLARINRQLGRTSEAEQLFRRSLAIFSATVVPDNPNRIMVVEEFAGFLREQGREKEAEELEATEAMVRSTQAGEKT